jgi:putrescine transport system permease protein
MNKLTRFFQSLFQGNKLVIGIPYGWFILLVAIPLMIVMKISLSEMEATSISSMISWTNGLPTLKLNFANYQFIFSDSLYVKTFYSSLKYALITTLICLAIGYPFAYFMARAPKHIQPTLLMLIMLPFWTSFLLRIYAWKTLLVSNGVINNVLLSLHVIKEPLAMMNNSFSLTIGMVYSYLPFMILPLYANLSKLDLRYLEVLSRALCWCLYLR